MDTDQSKHPTVIQMLFLEDKGRLGCLPEVLPEEQLDSSLPKPTLVLDSNQSKHPAVVRPLLPEDKGRLGRLFGLVGVL